MADDHIPEASEGIEKLTAIVVNKHGSSSTGPDMGLLLQAPGVERVNQHMLIAVSQRFGCEPRRGRRPACRCVQ
jgi:hypothetical protein